MSSEIRHLLIAKDVAINKELNPKAKLPKTKPKSVSQTAAAAAHLSDGPDSGEAAVALGKSSEEPKFIDEATSVKFVEKSNGTVVNYLVLVLELK
ncbi:hypothetical protein A6R68_16243, partial [Neotoma lepida]